MSNNCERIKIVQLIFSIVTLNILQCSSTIINIPQGRIRGVHNLSDRYKAYLGIPYATVTERYRDPGPPPVWDNTFNAVNESVNCEQIDRSTLEPTGQKDCLVLNVFTPMNSKKQLMPVMIVIPGGGFHFGLNIVDMFNPKYLVNKNIIVVTINYRLGAFGFLCLQTHQVPGNAGLKDQVAAIRWVKNNIQYFGGDSQSITLYGQSVGATSINYLLLSSNTDRLFQRVIMSSGSILVPYALDNNPVETASLIAKRMGYTTNDPEQLRKIYLNASSNDILRASHFDDINDPLALYVFRPCVDKSKESLVKGTPKELIESVIKKNVTIVLGYNNMEGIKWAERYTKDGLKNLDETFFKIIPYNIIFRTEEEKLSFTAEVKDFYFKNNTLDSYQPLIDYFTDSIVAYPLVATTKQLLLKNLIVYNYYFQYDSNRNLSKRKTRLAFVNGSSHTDDVYYAFDPSALRAVPLTLNDATIIDAMTSFWSNVSKTGNPSTKKYPWRASTSNEIKFLSIDKKIEMIPVPNKERMQFWQKVYDKYNSY